MTHASLSPTAPAPRRELVSDQDGQDLIEYALVSLLIGLAAIVSLGGLSNIIGNAFVLIATSLSSAF